MKKIWVSLLSFALILTLMPIQAITPVVKAADGPSNFTFADFSTAINAPTVVNSNRVNLAGTFGQVSASSISYSITRIVNGQPSFEVSSGSTTPLITGNNFLFPSIELFEGINEITVSGISSGSSGNTSNGIVTAKSYVVFNNVPVITDIELAGGSRLLDGVDQIVTSANPTLLVKADNATEVSINGIVAFNGAGGTFIHSGLTLTRGLNEIEIVARNASKSFAVTRSIVYFPANSATPHHVFANANNSEIQLDTNEVVRPFATPHTISGKIIVRLPNDSDTDVPPGISLELLKESTLQGTIPTSDVTVTLLRQTSTFREYSFETSGTFNTSGNGNYTLRVNTVYLGQSYIPTIPFTVRDATAPYIDDVRQLNSINETNPTSGALVTYNSDTRFANNGTVHQLPIWLVVNANNFDLANAGSTTALSASLNGVAIPSSDPSFRYTEFRTTTGSGTIQRRVYRIDALPEGEIKLDFSINAGTEQFTESRTFKFSPISSIQITNLYDGIRFVTDTNPVASIQGRLINFNLPDSLSASDQRDLSTLQFTLNGHTTNMGLNASPHTLNLGTGDFNYVLQSNLVYGANELVISGRANGIQVSTRLLVYWFSSTQPTVSGLVPVPHVGLPGSTAWNDRYQINDTTSDFTQLTPTSYTTTQTKFDLLFNVTNIQNLLVKVDGQDFPQGSAAVDPNNQNNLVIDAQNQNTLFAETNDGGARSYQLRLFGIELPSSGPKSITITATLGTESYTQTITITRELPPYELLSPKLPQEKVVNQNFLNISIRAEGADRIVIGKAEMVKKATEDLFRYQLKGLKTGNNTVKFTIHRGDEKLNGQFTVNYAADNTIGAQYKTSLSGNGKISAFKGELALTFPKNTFLRQANTTPGQPITSPDLFDSQDILFAIADRNDGRTVKIFNDVGDDQQGVAQDGTFKTVSYDEIGAAVIAPLHHFGFASNLFWIDPGYKSGVYTDGYQFTDGSHPYVSGNEFISRPLDRWLEPSNKGTITIKYDPAIRDVMANTLSMWRYYNGRWTNIGGVVNTKNNTITAPIDGFGYYAVKMLRFSFPDAIGHEYARNSVELMFSRGMMSNKTFNEFGVYDNITRGEFAQLLVKMFQIPFDYDNNVTFSDVPPILGMSNLWDYRYIETAARKGIVRGSGAQIFQPNEYLTREDAAVMIARAGELLKNTGDNFAKDRAALQKRFTDSNLIQNYSLASILAITNAKFIEGLPNTQLEGKPTYRFDPKSPLKRADAAIIAERVMRKNKLI